ncbi:hypothetical protein HW555_002226, partial [Spodoptera exigua]
WDEAPYVFVLKCTCAVESPASRGLAQCGGTAESPKLPARTDVTHERKTYNCGNGGWMTLALVLFGSPLLLDSSGEPLSPGTEKYGEKPDEKATKGALLV